MHVIAALRGGRPGVRIVGSRKYGEFSVAAPSPRRRSRLYGIFLCLAIRSSKSVA